MGENKELELAKKTFQATEIIPEERYQALLDEIHTIQGETIKLARDAVIQYKYKMGEAIVVELTRDNLQEYGIIITRLSKDLKISESELYRCVEFKTKYPDLEKALELFPEGENISWDKIKTQYLPEGGLARLSLAFPQMESLDKWGLIKWWESNPDKNFILFIKDPKHITQLKVTVMNNKDKEMTPLREAFGLITNYYISMKKIDKKDLDASDYARIHTSTRHLLLKSKGDMEKIKKAIDWVAGRDYIEWSIETVVKKYAESMRPVAKYERYLKRPGVKR